MPRPHQLPRRALKESHLVIVQIRRQIRVIRNHNRDVQHLPVVNSADAQQRRLEQMKNIRPKTLQMFPHRSPRRRHIQLRIKREGNRRQAHDLGPVQFRRASARRKDHYFIATRLQRLYRLRHHGDDPIDLRQERLRDDGNSHPQRILIGTLRIAAAPQFTKTEFLPAAGKSPRSYTGVIVRIFVG